MNLATDSGRLDQRPGALGAPPGPVLPPGTGVPLTALAPLSRILRVLLAGDVPGLRRRRVDDPGDVAAAGQDEPRLPADVLEGGVRGGPRDDVVVDRGHDVEVLIHVAQIQG